MKKVKKKKCSECPVIFTPTSSTTQVVCSWQCGLARANRKKRVPKETIKWQREQRVKQKSRSDWLDDAQAVFNRFIRLRDRGQPCISCGTTDPSIQYAAGHYRSRGAAPELRFCEDNVHLQCNSNCNKHLSGNPIPYRVNLIKKIGLDRVEWIEGRHDPLKLTIPEIRELMKEYRKKCKELLTVTSNTCIV